jgi:uncharacterized membrane protein
MRGLGKTLAEMKDSAKAKGKMRGSTKFWIGLALVLVGLYLLIAGITSRTISEYEIKSESYFEPEEVAKRDYNVWGIINLFSPIIILIGIILMIKGEIQKREESKLE